jgi:hypothetical protein
VWKVIKTKFEVANPEAPTPVEEKKLQCNDIAIGALHEALDDKTFEQAKNIEIAHDAWTLQWGRPGGYPRSYLTGGLAVTRTSLQGVPTRTRGRMSFSIPRQNIRVIDVSLHLYHPFTFWIYLMYLCCVLTFLA